MQIVATADESDVGAGTVCLREGNPVRFKGNPMAFLPKDLYIPPDALEVFLEQFEGPLDLLLYLIRRQNLDILDIPVAEITRQYLIYIDMMRVMSLELAAEYLLMAAILAEIKSRMLLPRVEVADDQEQNDPRAELARRLQDYELFRHAALEMDQLPRMDRDVFAITTDTSSIPVRRIPPVVRLDEVLHAMTTVLLHMDHIRHHQIRREVLSVSERMAAIISQLNHSEQVDFTRLFTIQEGRRGVVVAFLAILELCRDAVIDIIQEDKPYDIKIRIRLAAE